MVVLSRCCGVLVWSYDKEMFFLAKSTIYELLSNIWWQVWPAKDWSCFCVIPYLVFVHYAKVNWWIVLKLRWKLVKVTWIQDRYLTCSKLWNWPMTEVCWKTTLLSSGINFNVFFYWFSWLKDISQISFYFVRQIFTKSENIIPPIFSVVACKCLGQCPW